MSKDLATANTPPSPLRQLWDKLETTLRQPWDNNFEKNGPNQYQLWDNIGKTLGPHGDYLMTINGAPLCPVDSIWHFPPFLPDLFYQKNETLVFLRAIIIDHLFSTQRLGCICGFVNFVVFQTTFLLFPVSTSRHLLQFVLSLSPVPHRSGRKCSL